MKTTIKPIDRSCLVRLAATTAFIVISASISTATTKSLESPAIQPTSTDQEVGSTTTANETVAISACVDAEGREIVCPTLTGVNSRPRLDFGGPR